MIIIYIYFIVKHGITMITQSLSIIIKDLGNIPEY
jgi:hypothetical protein